MWKRYFNIFNAIVNAGLILSAFYLGIFKQQYGHASFLILIAMLNQYKVL
jgi:hypothetical protein